MSDNKDNQELITNLIAVTRNQLSSAMNANAELEAMLTIERKRNDELEAQLAELKKSEAK
jgi:hypothetical protein